MKIKRYIFLVAALLLMGHKNQGTVDSLKMAEG